MVDKKIVLRFPKRLVDRPIVSHLIKDHDLEFTILKASVTQDEEGLMVLELKGKQEEYDKGIAYLKEAGVILESLSQDVTRNEERCTHCGACITVCPVGLSNWIWLRGRPVFTIRNVLAAESVSRPVRPGPWNYISKGSHYNTLTRRCQPSKL